MQWPQSKLTTAMFNPEKKVTWRHSDSIQTLEVVTFLPLSHAHLPSSDTILDRWGWNEVCQMQLQSSHSKCISPIGLTSVIYHILLLSFSFVCVASSIMCHWQWQPNSVKLMTRMAYVLNLISNNIKALLFSKAALCPVCLVCTAQTMVTLLLNKFVWKGCIFFSLPFFPLIISKSKLSWMLKMNPNYGFQSVLIDSTELYKQTFEYKAHYFEMHPNLHHYICAEWCNSRPWSPNYVI